jgi:hypothetical protein
LIYVILGVFAAVQVLQAKKTRELAYRPYVVVDFEFRRFLVYIWIKKISQTPAANVTINFDQRLKTVGMQKDPNKASVFTAPIPIIAPNRCIRVTFGVSHQLLTAQDVPQRYEATVRYAGLDAKSKSYSETYVLDLSHYANAAVDPKGLPELVGELETMRRELQKWTDGSHGLLPLAVNQDRHVARRDRPYCRAPAKS